MTMPYAEELFGLLLRNVCRPVLPSWDGGPKRKLSDATDFKQWLKLLRAAARKATTVEEFKERAGIL